MTAPGPGPVSRRADSSSSLRRPPVDGRFSSSARPFGGQGGSGTTSLLANEDGTPNTELPVTTVRVTIEEIGGGKTRMTIVTEFPTVEAMEQLAMGVEEGGRKPSGRSTRSSPKDAIRLVERGARDA